jgi:hypothetical protein
MIISSEVLGCSSIAGTSGSNSQGRKGRGSPLMLRR